jgi:hypothetical protein
MKHWLTLLTPFILFSMLLVTFSRDETMDFKQPAITDDKERVPVLVELFTSEGCSSCPPADELLAQLQDAGQVAGARIITLSEHVDYWNYIGWTDPFSSQQFSIRQSQYAKAFGKDNAYTPQMIVDGRFEFVGSNRNKALDAIARSAQSPKLSIEIARVNSKAGIKSGAISLSVRVEKLSDLSAGDSAELLLAVTEDRLSSEIPRGENAGRRLSHAAVVRSLSAIGRLNKNDTFAADPVVTVAAGWRLENLRAIVFVQEVVTRRVLGVAEIRLSKEK